MVLCTSLPSYLSWLFDEYLNQYNWTNASAMIKQRLMRSITDI